MGVDSQHGENNSDLYTQTYFFWIGLGEGESKVARWHRNMAKPLRKNPYQGKKESMAISQ